MKRVTIQAPFTDGLVTDVPAHLLGPRMASQAENMLVIDGVARRRRGWSYTGGSTMTADIKGVRTADFALAGTSRRIVTTSVGAFDELTGIQVMGEMDNAINFPIAFDEFLPRCMYRDELILCHQSGQRGLIRYAGAGWSSGGNDSWTYQKGEVGTAVDSTANTSTATYTVTAVSSVLDLTVAQLTNSNGAGWFWFDPSMGVYSAKVLNSSTNDFTVDGIVFPSAYSTGATNACLQTFGGAYPAVSVYSAGAVTYDNGTNVVTGVGTQWSGGSWGSVQTAGLLGSHPSPDSLLIYRDASGSAIVSIRFSPGTATTGFWGQTPVPASITTPSQYGITRGLPFTDACVHRDSLVGTGCAQYANRVYICPPGWNLTTPPGFQGPLTVYSDASYKNADPNFFLVDFIDVPSSVDTDAMEAVISSPGPILALKTDDAHGIYGDFPNFTQALLPNGKGSGCFDKRSTVDCRWGQFWAGHNGVFHFTGGRVMNVTEGRIETTWRNLAAEHHGQAGFYCAAGVCGSKLFVSIGHDGDAGETLSYDLVSQRWDGFITNHQAIGFDDPVNEVQSLVWAAAPIASDPEKLRDSGPMVDGEGPVVDGALLTTAAAPVMTATTGTGMARNEGIDGLSKMVDLAVSAEVEGPATGHSKLTPSAEIAGGIDDENENSTTALPAIEPTASVSAIQRTRGRINRKGRTFGVKVDTTSTPSGNAQNADYDVKVHQITASFRDSRERA